MDIDRLLCLTLNTIDSLKQFLEQIFPKIQLKLKDFPAYLNFNLEDLGNVFLAF